jgi:NADH dehydrogenase
MNIPDSSLPRVVIVGGGFGGLQLVKHLPRGKFQVVLIDKHNYHTFQPLLYQVATAGLEPDSIAYPLRKIFKKRNDFYFRMTEVIEIETDKDLVRTTIGQLQYDYLVLATGSATNFFGNDRLEKLAMGMKSVPEALNIRSLLLQNFEAALLTDDLKERESLMNVVIVGAGPTGVELAGAIAELKRHVLPTDYPDLDFRRMNIHLVEAAERVLPPMSVQSSAKAKKYLEKLGVQVWLSTMVKSYNGKEIETSNKPMLTQTLIWAAGVKCTPPGGISGDALVRGNRMAVNEFNLIKGYKNVYAIGDLAYMETERFPQGHPMVAQPAIQQGRLLGRNLGRQLTGEALKPFKYRDMGSMATIGRTHAVADLPGYKTQGAFAWLVWMFVHLIALVGFRNKVVVFINWTWNFFNYNRDIRLIIRPFKRPL